MRFYVEGLEREPHDAQERIAMLKHRLGSISYWDRNIAYDHVHYAFRSQGGDQLFLLLEFEDAASLDMVIKRDPQFPYMTFITTPVVSTKQLCEEIEDFLGEALLEETLMQELDAKPVTVDPDANYVLVHKWQPPFSPLLPDRIQTDILRRTVTSQRAHNSSLEISDVNPVGSAIGIHISQADAISEASKPVEATEIFPDTVVKYYQLHTMSQARDATLAHLRRYGQSVALEEIENAVGSVS